MSKSSSIVSQTSKMLRSNRTTSWVRRGLIAAFCLLRVTDVLAATDANAVLFAEEEVIKFSSNGNGLNLFYPNPDVPDYEQNKERQGFRVMVHSINPGFVNYTPIESRDGYSDQGIDSGFPADFWKRVKTPPKNLYVIGNGKITDELKVRDVHWDFDSTLPLVTVNVKDVWENETFSGKQNYIIKAEVGGKEHWLISKKDYKSWRIFEDVRTHWSRPDNKITRVAFGTKKSDIGTIHKGAFVRNYSGADCYIVQMDSGFRLVEVLHVGQLQAVSDEESRSKYIHWDQEDDGYFDLEEYADRPPNGIADAPQCEILDKTMARYQQAEDLTSYGIIRTADGEETACYLGDLWKVESEGEQVVRSVFVQDGFVLKEVKLVRRYQMMYQRSDICDEYAICETAEGTYYYAHQLFDMDIDTDEEDAGKTLYTWNENPIKVTQTGRSALSIYVTCIFVEVVYDGDGRTKFLPLGLWGGVGEEKLKRGKNGVINPCTSLCGDEPGHLPLRIFPECGHSIHQLCNEKLAYAMTAKERKRKNPCSTCKAAQQITVADLKIRLKNDEFSAKNKDEDRKNDEFS